MSLVVDWVLSPVPVTQTQHSHCAVLNVQLEANIFGSWSLYKHLLCRIARISCPRPPVERRPKGILEDLGQPIMSVKL